MDALYFVWLKQFGIFAIDCQDPVNIAQQTPVAAMKEQPQFCFSNVIGNHVTEITSYGSRVWPPSKRCFTTP